MEFRFFICLAALFFNCSSFAGEINDRCSLANRDQLNAFQEALFSGDCGSIPSDQFVTLEMLFSVLSVHQNNSADHSSNSYQQKPPCDQYINELHKTELYKTELCKNWQREGNCRYGEKCKFAHGQRDQRNKFVHPNYKTKHCANYAQGFCPYGNRCNFIH